MAQEMADMMGKLIGDDPKPDKAERIKGMFPAGMNLEEAAKWYQDKLDRIVGKKGDDDASATE